MAFAVSKIFLSAGTFVTDWLLCPESVALFVLSLLFLNCLRLVRFLFICFCRWKYRNVADLPSSREKTLCADLVNGKDSLLSCKGNGGFRQYSHEARMRDMAAFSIQGRRKTMEDRFNSISHNFESNHSVYAVFDGHGGEFAAEFIEEQLFRSIQKEFSRGSFQADLESVQKVLTSVIRTVDAQLVCLSRDRMDLSGSTGVIAFQIENLLAVANIGDSRAVMCDCVGRVVPLSVDHKPSDPKEQKRIVEAGGFVTFNGVWRVAGVLATSRAFGDYPLKQRKFVTVEPEFQSCDISKTKPHFLILASDGLWDVFSNEDAVRFISERLDEPHFGAKSLALQAYYRGSLDNITVMIINVKKKVALQRKYDHTKEDRGTSSGEEESDEEEEDGKEKDD